MSYLPINNVNKCALAIMAKAPNPGEVKTRLIPPLEPETSASLYHNFILDKINQVKNIKEAKPFIAYTPEKSEPFFKKIAPGFTLISQVGADLGMRLTNLSNTLLNQGYRKVVILDSDTPNLPLEYIRLALQRLDQFDIILGPCEDGGYYLIGLKSFFPEIFNEIPWSTSRVTKLTIKKAEAIGLTIFLLNEWYDVDTLKDLIRLKRDLDSKLKNRDDNFCENTYRFISDIDINRELFPRNGLQKTDGVF